MKSGIGMTELGLWSPSKIPYFEKEYNSKFEARNSESCESVRRKS